jgi:predicted DNA-binding transcriptional regulator
MEVETVQEGKIEVFGKVPVKILEDTRVTHNELKVYTALVAYQGKNKSCYPRLQTISNRTKIHVRAVRRAVLGLIEKGWVTKVRRFGASNVYKCTVNNNIPMPEVNGRIIHCKQLDNSGAGKAVRKLMRTVNVPISGH